MRFGAVWDEDGWAERLGRRRVKDPGHTRTDLPSGGQEPPRTPVSPVSVLASSVLTCPYDCGYSLTVRYGAHNVPSHTPDEIETILAEHMGGHTLALIVEHEIGPPPSVGDGPTGRA